METIDQKVTTVIKKELKKNVSQEKNLNNIVFESNPLFDSIQPEYTILPKDTIGKNIYFNTERK